MVTKTSWNCDPICSHALLKALLVAHSLHALRHAGIAIDIELLMLLKVGKW